MTQTLASVDNDTVKLDIDAIRADFPVLSQKVYGQDLVYLDSAASAQKPQQVISAMQAVLESGYSNVHRGVHYLSSTLTAQYEAVRGKVANFLNAASEDNIVFTANATDAFNLVAQSWGRKHLTQDDVIIISEMEHHANIVPWQLIQQEIGFELRIAKITEQGALDFASYQALIDEKVKLVAISHGSNVLGTVTPAANIVAAAHKVGAKVLLDGSQAVVHMPVDVQEIGADFYIFTGHKLYGPTGIGVLYATAEMLDAMPPWRGGGDMIDEVSFDGTTFKSGPARFEAGTPAIVETIGLGAAIDYISDLGMDNVYQYEQELRRYAETRLAELDWIYIYGQAPEKACIFSFNIDGIHAQDAAMILDRAGVAVRVGHHCAQPLMKRLGVTSTLRASFAVYNTKSDVDALIEALHTVKKLFG